MKGLIDDPDLNLAMLEAAGPIYGAARNFADRLPPVTTDAFLEAPLVVRQAALIVVGIAAVHRTEPGLFNIVNYPGGKYHRNHVLDEHTALMKRRYPPSGDRSLWIKYGPAGPPVEVAPEAAA